VSDTAADKLEHVRRVGAEIGVPMDCLNTLAVPPKVAAKLLSISHSMVEKLIREGELPCFNVGRLTRIELTELVEFIEANRRAPRRTGDTSKRRQAIDLIEGRA